MRAGYLATSLVVLLFASAPLPGGEAMDAEMLKKLPVKEVTVFKDGHAFVLHEGSVPTDKDGNVRLDYLPRPVIGTFWPYVSDKTPTLKSVVAGKHKIRVERTALTMRELLEANLGAEVRVTEKPWTSNAAGDPLVYDATVTGWAERSSAELAAAAAPYAGEALPVKGEIIFLKTEHGTKAVNIGRILDITFKEEHRARLYQEEFRNLLTLHLDWDGKTPNTSANVGMVYVQRGIRWIPSYRVVIDGKGGARVELQGTLVNELADLEKVTAHLVIGVPSFAFKDNVDPMSLQQAVAQLSRHFQENAQTAYAFSNAIMTQQEMPVRRARPSSGGGETIDLGPDVAVSGKSEDLYMFTVNDVTLAKGQRMVVRIAEFTLPYRDIYVLDIPFAPPGEILRHFNHNQRDQLYKLLVANKAKHRLRFTNNSSYPLTTAPASILKEGRILAQGMMTYTPIGAESDLELTTAVNVQVKKADKETKRTPNAATWHGNSYGRIDLEGKITVGNYSDKPIELEIARHVLGNVDEAGQDGEVEMVNVHEDRTFARDRPSWWGWYSWPYWWSHFNSVGRIRWEKTLQPGESLELAYTWHYYWR